jgi:hypothetical protein
MLLKLNDQHILRIVDYLLSRQYIGATQVTKLREILQPWMFEVDYRPGWPESAAGRAVTLVAWFAGGAVIDR